jgi:L-fucose isomerase-like protein
MKNILGVIFGNRDFFPDHLVTEARKDIKGIMLSEKDSKLGGVETYMDARKCAELFKQHRDAFCCKICSR